MIVAIIAAVLVFLVAGALTVFLFMRMRDKNRSSVHKKKPIVSVEALKSSSHASSGEQTQVRHSSRLSGGEEITEQYSINPADDLRSRFNFLSLMAAGVFGILAFRLAQLQLLDYAKYTRNAEDNQYNNVLSPAPRGEILDFDGRALVKNRSSIVVLADADVLDNHDVMARLSAVLGLPYNVVKYRISDSSSGALSQRVVASDVRLRDIAFIGEHADAFDGIDVETRTLRQYPYGALASHVLGYISAVSSEDLESIADGRNIELGDDIGRSGVESAYDQILAGDHGSRKVIADSLGNVVEVVSEIQPVKGSDVYLTIKGPVQYACDSALADLIAPTGVIGKGTGTAGAVVIMDVRDGGIVAMSSYPMYAPANFVGGISQEIWDLYSADESYYPMFNRAVSGTYPAASTFKAFTGLAGLEYGFATDEKTWKCTGTWDAWGKGNEQNCWLHTGHGTLNFREGIVNSCDVVFYEIGRLFYEYSALAGNSNPKVDDTALQEYLEKFGFGSITGFDLAGEESGRIPTPAWKEEYYRDAPEQIQWQGGDTTNMMIGQGYVLVTPLQIAVAYGAIATGNIMKPHVLKEVHNSAGEVALSYEPQIVATLGDIPEERLEFMRDALMGVSSENESVKECFTKVGLDPYKVASKTGTAEVTGKKDYSWFACYAPLDDPKYVVACVVEQGGGGSATAGPLGAKLLAYALAYDEGELTEMGTIAGSTGESVPYEAASSGRTD